MFFFKNHGKNEAGRLAPDLLLFFKKALYEVKVVPWFRHIMKAECIKFKTADAGICSILIF